MAQAVNERQAAALLAQSDRILILCHQKPDGDTLGSGFALLYALLAMGKTARIACPDGFPPRYCFLYPGFVPERQPDFTPSCIVAVDVADLQLLGAWAGRLAGKIDLCIDHHPSNTGYAKSTLLDAGCAATGELIWLLGEKLGYSPAPAFCDAVYTAISTDTGCFCYSNTTPQTHRIAALCMENGADFSRLNRQLFETKSWKRIQVENHVFQNIQLSAQGKIAAVCLTKEALDRLEATKDELDNLSALPRQIEGVCCSILLSQVGPGRFKGSVRTDAPVDASRLCARFGGGGHARAAGCTLEGEGEDCLSRLVKAAQEELGYV